MDSKAQDPAAANGLPPADRAVSFEGASLAQALAQVRAQTGARLFVLGDAHDKTEVISRHIIASLAEQKAMGVTTLYTEMPTDAQPLFERAFQGDPQALKELREHFDQWWSYGGEGGAQARFDLIMAAHQLGMRVINVDAAASLQHPEWGLGYATEAELYKQNAVRDALMAHNIAKADDGQLAIVHVGHLHTSPVVPEEKIRDAANDPAQAALNAVRRRGGVEQHLREYGIPASSIDYAVTADAAQTYGPGVAMASFATASEEMDSDFTLQLTDPLPYSKNVNQAALFRVSLARLDQSFETAAEQAHGAGDKPLAAAFNKLSGKTEALAKLLTAPDFVALPPDAQNDRLMTLTQEIGEALYYEDNLKGKINDKELRVFIDKTFTDALNLTQSVDDHNNPVLPRDNAVLNSPEERSRWHRATFRAPGE